MTDATTANYGWTKPAVGADSNNWGTLLNADLDSIDADLKTVANAVAAVFSAGMILQWFGTAAACPSGWAICDGTNGTPDLRGQFVLGAASDSGSGGATPVGSTGGSATAGFTTDGHALTTAELPAHNHGVNDPGHAHGVSDPGHSHGFTANPHNHGVSDPGHSHVMPGAVDNNAVVGGTFNVSGGNLEVLTPSPSTATSGTGISLGAATVTGSIASASTGITGTGSVATGVSTQNTGSGAAHSHTGTVAAMPPYRALYYIMKLA